jgi:GNAT superfamily N-acetyltransferase
MNAKLALQHFTQPGPLSEVDDSLHHLAAQLPAEWSSQRPQGLVAVRDGPAGPMLARLSWWADDAPPLAGFKPGVIGHFAASSSESARLAMDGACSTLSSLGCDLALGPMDGNTWRKYRYVTETSDEPPFFLEPCQPETYPRWWSESGFTPFERYYSAVDPDLTRTDPRLASVEERLLRVGVEIRPIRLDSFASELRMIHDLSLASFAGNVLYTPIGFEEFAAMYNAARPFVDPAFTRLAIHEGGCAGFVFALPDLLEAKRGLTARTLVVKTLAVRPGRILGGLGALLLQQVKQAAAARGFQRAIHALMHETNRSRNMAGPGAREIRSYTLFKRAL